MNPTATGSQPIYQLSQDAHEIQEETPDRSPIVPLPYELPQSPNLANLPISILHSGTVETLIGQNEDLTARLMVNIRRNSKLEQQILALEQENDDLTSANASLLSQQQILQEKDMIIREKSVRNDQQALILKEETELQQLKIKALENRNQELRAATRFQRRVRTWVAPLLKKMKNQLATERRAVTAREAVISDLRERLAQAMSQVQNAQANSVRDQARLVEQYENRQKNISTELAKYKADTKSLAEKAARLDQALTQAATVENRLILTERQNREIQASADSFRKEAKTLAIEAKSREQELETLRKSTQEAVSARDTLQDQFESLQTVWADSQKRLEAAKLQVDTLNRLNQELSRQLKDLRKRPESQSAS